MGTFLNSNLQEHPDVPKLLKRTKEEWDNAVAWVTRKRDEAHFKLNSDASNVSS